MNASPFAPRLAPISHQQMAPLPEDERIRAAMEQMRPRYSIGNQIAEASDASMADSRRIEDRLMHGVGNGQLPPNSPFIRARRGPVFAPSAAH